MAGVRINVLGGFEARLASGADARVTSRKARALLCYLVLNAPRSCERGRLAGLLWSDSAEAQARSSLRQELRKLRRALGPNPEVLRADGDRIGLVSGAINADAIDF